MEVSEEATNGTNIKNLPKYLQEIFLSKASNTPIVNSTNSKVESTATVMIYRKEIT